MTEISTVQPPTSEEQEQIRQTIEMFEVITQANPQDSQSMEILKEAYTKMGMEKEALSIGRKLADIYMELGQYSSAMLEYENILHKEPGNAEVVAALGEVEQRLQALQVTDQGINLDFRSVVMEGSRLIETKQTHSSGRLRIPIASENKVIDEKLSGSDDGNDALVRFLLQHRLAPEGVVSQALHIVRKRNTDRSPTQIAASLIDEIVTRGSVNLESLLCGILDRSKFAYIPLECYDIDRHIVKMLPDALTLGRLMVPFDVISRTMMVAVANPFDTAGKETVQQLVDYNIQWHLASPEAIFKVLQGTHRAE